jgi:hypothetical protein
VIALPTPTARDWKDNEVKPAKHRPKDTTTLNRALFHLLPTPAVNDMGDGKTLEWWEEWAPRQMSSDGRPAPHGKSLAIEALKMLPTPTSQAAKHGELSPVEKHGQRPQDDGNLWVVIPKLHGATTAPPSNDGPTPSDAPHPHQLSLGEQDNHA